MPSLPIPLISSLVLGFLLLQMWMAGRKIGLLAALLALCAVQGLIISLAQHYDIAPMRALQPVTATLIAPLGWIAFQSTAVRRIRKTDLLFFLGAPISAVCLFVMPDLLDVLIPTLFFGFGGAVLVHSLKGADALPLMRLESGDLPGRIWQVIGIMLIASGFSDIFIVAANFLGADYLRPWIVSLYSSATLLIIGGLCLSGALANDVADLEEAQAPLITEIDTQIVARLDELMRSRKLYLNPDLTLSQLSRQLLVPVKQLSGAINRVKGENVSRTINAARIAAAQEALLAGQNVTSAMLSSGFNTKSNFNREFLRVAGKSPSDWLEEQKT